MLHADVGGRIAELAAHLVAMHDAAVDDIGAAEQFGSALQIAGPQRIAHGGAGHANVGGGHGTHCLDAEAEGFAGLLQQAKSPARFAPKRKSSPMIR